MMTVPALAFGAERGQLDRANHDFLARARIGLGQDSAVEVADHAAARPGKGGIVGSTCPLVGRHDVGEILDDARPIEKSPPFQRWCGSPGVHASRDTVPDFGPGKCERSDGLGKEPVVTNCNAQAANLDVHFEIRSSVLIDLDYSGSLWE